jgi:MFS transporter, ACS family, glucarate transporter
MTSAPSRTRYHVLLLSFVVALVMYLDRACMGTASMSISKEFAIDKTTMGFIASAFTLTYSLFQVPGGWLADRYGSRIVLTLAIVWWSLFTMGSGLAWSVTSMLVMRALFGMGEAGMARGFPIIEPLAAGTAAWIRTRISALRLTLRGCAHAGPGALSGGYLRLANGVLRVRSVRLPFGGGLVLFLSR